MTLVKISELVKDPELYPRAGVDPVHVSAITHALKAGAQMPPLLVQKGSRRIIDGYHRAAALERIYGNDAEVKVNFSDVSDAEMFTEAMRSNNSHGRPLSPFDRARSITISRGLGLPDDVTATALNITRERLDAIVVDRLTADGQVLKRTLGHLAGTRISDAQAHYNKIAGGMNQLFYINQAIALIESDSIDWQNQAVAVAVRKLTELLNARPQP